MLKLRVEVNISLFLFVLLYFRTVVTSCVYLWVSSESELKFCT